MTAQQKKKGSGKTPGSAANVVAILLMGLAAGMMVLLGAGLLISALVVRGSAGMESMGWVALVSMFLAALAGGWFVARKMHKMPLVWSLCAAAEIVVTTLAIGALTYGISSPRAAILRLCAALAGGAAAGVLSAARKK